MKIKHHARLESGWHFAFAFALSLLTIAAWIGYVYHELHERGDTHGSD